MKRRPTIIRWYDARHDSGWVPTKAGLAECVSIGFEIKRTEEYIALAQTLDEKSSEDMSDVLLIPTNNVRSVRRL